MICYCRYYLFATRLLLEHSLSLPHTKIATPREIIVPKNLDFTDSAYRKKLQLLVAKFGNCALIRSSAEDLARHSSVSVTTIRHAELMPSATALTRANDQAIRPALENAGVEFIDAEGGGAEYACEPRRRKSSFSAAHRCDSSEFIDDEKGGPGVRLRMPPAEK